MTSELNSTRALRRAALTVALTLLAVLAVLWFLLQIRSLLYMIFVALFISVAIEPAVQFLARRGWRRGLATGVVFVGLVLAGVALVALVVPVVISQVVGLVQDLPGYINTLEQQVGSWLGIDLLTPEAASQFDSLASIIQNFGSGIAGGLVGLGSTVLGATFQLFTIALFSFYMVAEGPALRRTVLSFLPAQRQREALRIWEIAVEKTGGYVYSRLILAVLSGVFTTGLLLFLRLPFAIALGVWVGVLSQFVPVIGTYLGAVLPVLVALANSPIKALWVVVGLVAYQQVENLLIGPRVTSRTMAIHPAVSVGAIVVGASLMGATGVVLALPAAAVIQAVISTTIDRHRVIDEAHRGSAGGDPARPGQKVDEGSGHHDAKGAFE
ncbi:MAG: AI-2E family transporter [Acidimicrobiia bacterium]